MKILLQPLVSIWNNIYWRDLRSHSYQSYLKELPVARLFDVTITEQSVLSGFLHLNSNKPYAGPDNLVCYNCMFNQSL